MIYFIIQLINDLIAYLVVLLQNILYLLVYVEAKVKMIKLDMVMIGNSPS